ncbi:MAG TPA: hypothetical protein VEH27_11035 [Methylomirabilota bacterium]|nr:hypothetical protein [Methylomirabilota bacterium]
MNKIKKAAFYLPVLAAAGVVSTQAAVDESLTTAIADLETFALATLAIIVGVAVVKIGYRVFRKLGSSIG